jgi:DNA-binding beta-propeller fold protein YncE
VDRIKPGGEGGWDYLIAEPTMERLYVSRGTHVQVIDLVKDTLVGDIPNTNGVHGIAIAVEFGKGYISDGRDSAVTVFDLKTLATLKKIKIDAVNPDAIVYDPFTKRVFTFNGRSSNATAIDASTDAIVGNMALDGKPEFAASDANGKMYVNLEDKSKIVEFDPKDLKVLNTWSLAPGDGPSGLAIDPENHRLFSGCGNKKMVVLDAQSGKLIDTIAIGEGVDACGFDPGTQFAFSSNGEGTLTVVKEDSPDKFSVVENVPTQKSARTMAVDTKTHRVYLSCAEFGPPPEPTADHPHPRGQMIPGSFTILVLAR